MNRAILKKIIITLTFFMLCTVSFAQNIKVIGVIPKTDTGKMYQLQIGAYRLAANVNKASDMLKKTGFVPQCEKKGDLVRVFIVVKATEVRSAVDRLGKAGFKEVVIREYSSPASVETKESEDTPPHVEEELAEEEILEETEEIEELEEIEFEDYKFEEYEEPKDFEEPYEMSFNDYEDPEHDLIHLY